MSPCPHPDEDRGRTSLETPGSNPSRCIPTSSTVLLKIFPALCSPGWGLIWYNPVGRRQPRDPYLDPLLTTCLPLDPASLIWLPLLAGSMASASRRGMRTHRFEDALLPLHQSREVSGWISTVTPISCEPAGHHWGVHEGRSRNPAGVTTSMVVVDLAGSALAETLKVTGTP